MLTCTTTTDDLIWRKDGITFFVGTGSSVGRVGSIAQLDFYLTEMSQERVVSTVVIEIIATSDNGIRIFCGNGQTELSRDVVVADTGLLLCFTHVDWVSQLVHYITKNSQ